MTEYNVGAAAIALICLTALVTPSYASNTIRGSTMPELDMQPGCKATADQDLVLEEKPSIQSCLDEEKAAQQKLEGVWPTFSANDRRECTTAIQVGGPPSYINLFWCLEDAKAARAFEQKPVTGGVQPDAPAVLQDRPEG